MAGARVSGEPATPNGVSAISANFNGTPIPGGDFIWFNSVLKVQGLDSDPVTIGFGGSIQFVANGSLYLVSVPTAIVTFSPAVAVATTVYCNGQWVTTVPLSGLSGNVFLDGVAFQAPRPQRISRRHQGRDLAGHVLQPDPWNQSAMAVGGRDLPRPEFRRRLQPARRETG